MSATRSGKSHVAAVLLCAVGLLAPSACAQSDAPFIGDRERADLVVIEAGDQRHKINVELADTNEKRRVGLMYRETLAEDAGMLFDFGDPQPISMWMKNTLISLDMAFIDQNGVIKRITANTTPRSLESLPSGEPVVAVLEVNAGVFERLGVKPGAVVRHPMFETEK
ncbi:MAG: DUF192 domain-containing protein [Pseudomonadota bacterium]